MVSVVSVIPTAPPAESEAQERHANAIPKARISTATIVTIARRVGIRPIGIIIIVIIMATVISAIAMTIGITMAVAAIATMPVAAMPSIIPAGNLFDFAVGR